MTMRLMVESEMSIAGGLIGVGVEQIRWPRPVHAGDVLRVECEVLETRPSRSNPDRGIVQFKSKTLNQDGEVVMEQIASLIAQRDPKHEIGGDSLKSCCRMADRMRDETVFADFAVRGSGYLSSRREKGAGLMAGMVGRVALMVILTMGAVGQTRGQVTGTRTPEDPPPLEAFQPADAAALWIPCHRRAHPLTFGSRLFDRLWSTLSQEEDPDGPINTDRPTFTPANTVVPLGRRSVRVGLHVRLCSRTSRPRSTVYDFPELAMRVGVAKRVEFRTYWFGQTYSQT